MIRKRFVFNGRVQGVGFRYLTRRAADLIGVTGWVRNERDGSVILEIQGTEEQVDGVMLALKHMIIKRVQVILQASTQAPTAGNQQLYTILRITDPVKKHRLSISCGDARFWLSHRTTDAASQAEAGQYEVHRP